MNAWPFSVEFAKEIHALVVSDTGGSAGVRDKGLLESALHRPPASWGGVELYPTPVAKAAALAHALVRNHPFVDGNKRTATVLMMTLLRLNGRDLRASDDDAEKAIVSLAAGEMSLEAFKGMAG